MFLRKGVANGVSDINNTIGNIGEGRNYRNNSKVESNESNSRINRQSERIKGQEKNIQQRGNLQTAKRNENQGLEESSSFNLQKNRSNSIRELKGSSGKTTNDRIASE